MHQRSRRQLVEKNLLRFFPVGTNQKDPSLLITYQADVCIETFLDVLPVELDAAGSDPQKDDSG